MKPGRVGPDFGMPSSVHANCVGVRSCRPSGDRRPGPRRKGVFWLRREERRGLSLPQQPGRPGGGSAHFSASWVRLAGRGRPDAVCSNADGGGRIRCLLHAVCWQPGCASADPSAARERRWPRSSVPTSRQVGALSAIGAHPTPRAAAFPLGPACVIGTRWRRRDGEGG